MKYLLIVICFVWIGCKDDASNTTTLIDKRGYWIKQGLFDNTFWQSEKSITTWVWKDGNILEAWQDKIDSPDSIRLLRIEQAKRYIQWHKTLKDTIIKVD